jgi:hypothetical protein
VLALLLPLAGAFSLIRPAAHRETPPSVVANEGVEGESLQQSRETVFTVEDRTYGDPLSGESMVGAYPFASVNIRADLSGSPAKGVTSIHEIVRRSLRPYSTE